MLGAARRSRHGGTRHIGGSAVGDPRRAGRWWSGTWVVCGWFDTPVAGHAPGRGGSYRALVDRRTFLLAAGVLGALSACSSAVADAPGPVDGASGVPSGAAQSGPGWPVVQTG